MSELNESHIEELRVTVNNSLEVLFKTISKRYNELDIKIRDLEQEIDIVRNEISSLRRKLRDRGIDV